MTLRLPRYDNLPVQDELASVEPLQPGRQAQPAAPGPGAKGLPSIALTPRVVRASNWVPPTMRPNSKVAVYYVNDQGHKTDTVEVARVVCFMPKERQVTVRLGSGVCKTVPMFWVLDYSLAGTPRHPLHSPTQAEDEATDIEGLKAALLHRYGSTIAAWHAIDLFGDDKARFEAFALACRQIRFHGDLNDAFADIAAGRDVVGGATVGSGGGATSVNGGAPQAVSFRDFRSWMSSQGEFQEASQILPGHSRAPGQSSARSSARAAEDARELNLQDGVDGIRRFRTAMHRQFGDLARAWVEIDTNHDGVLQMREFCSACRRLSFAGNLKRIWEALVDGEPEPELEEDERFARPEKLDPQLPEMLRKLLGKDLTSRTRKALPAHLGGANPWDPPMKPSSVSTRMVANDAKTFRDSMVKKFGSFSCAWAALDPDGRRRLSYQDFLLGCHRAEFVGNYKQVFEDLSGGRGVLTAADLDPGLPFALRAATESAAKEPAAAAAAAAFGAASPAPRRMSLATQRGSALASMTAPEEPGPRFDEGRRRSATTMAEVHKALQESSMKDAPQTDAAYFRSAIIKKFGSYAAAWLELDARGRDEVSYANFVSACRGMSIGGNFKLIFQELTAGEEFLVPDDLHPGLAAAVAKLRGPEDKRPSTTGSSRHGSLSTRRASVASRR